MERKMQEQQRMKMEALQKQQQQQQLEQQQRMMQSQEQQEWQQRVQKTREAIHRQEQPKPEPAKDLPDGVDGRIAPFQSSLQHVAPGMPNSSSFKQQQTFQQQSHQSQQSTVRQTFSYQPMPDQSQQRGWQAQPKKHVEPHFLHPHEEPQKPSWVKEDKPQALHQPPWHQGQIPEQEVNDVLPQQQQQQFVPQQQQFAPQQQQMVQQPVQQQQQQQQQQSFQSQSFQSNQSSSKIE